MQQTHALTQRTVAAGGRERRQPRGFGFIEFSDERDAADAQYKMDNTTVLGRQVTVVFAQEVRKAPDVMREREGGGRGGGGGGGYGGPRGGGYGACARLALDRFVHGCFSVPGLPSLHVFSIGWPPTYSWKLWDSPPPVHKQGCVPFTKQPGACTRVRSVCRNLTGRCR